jgi:hypothetical protein
MGKVKRIGVWYLYFVRVLPLEASRLGAKRIFDARKGRKEPQRTNAARQTQQHEAMFKAFNIIVLNLPPTFQ